MQKQLTNTELDLLLQDVINSTLLLHNYSSDYFQDLYLTGCRSRELLLPDKWKLYSDKAALSTMKTEAIRIFPMSVLSSNFLSSLANGHSPYNGLTYDQLTKEFRTVVKLHPIYSGERIADTYLFRYNRARIEFAKRQNLKEVMDYFGWFSENVASKYITTPLIYDPHKPG
jgi:hypothetical protein